MKSKAKKILLKLICLVIGIFIAINIFISNKVFAGWDDIALRGGLDVLEGGTVFLAGGGIGLAILYLLKLIILIPGILGFTITHTVLWSLGDNFFTDITIGIPQIIFAGASDGSKFLDVNFFDVNSGGIIAPINEAIAKWYYILRLISTAILLVILIYVGIRMALSTISEEQAKYKKMLVDWATSLALLFLLHYIIIFVISINNSLVQTLRDINGSTMNLDLYDKNMILTALSVGIKSFFPCILFTIAGGMTFSFLLLYIKRKITVGFLIMIAPLITITYSIDKMGDGKAQALNAWLKELTYNILIQPFHCIIYMCFMGAVIGEVTSGDWSIGPYILAIVILSFMKKAEDILRKIFHFEAHSMSSMSEAGQNMLNATGKFGKMGMAAGAGIVKFKNSGAFASLKEAKQDYKINKGAKNQLKKDFKAKQNSGAIPKDAKFNDYLNSDDGKRNLRTTAQEMKKKAEDKKIDKARKKFNKKHKGTGKTFDEEVNKSVDKQIDKQVDSEFNKTVTNKNIEDTARRRYDEDHGKGAYDKLKEKASQKDIHGNSTRAAEYFQKELNNANKAGTDIIKSNMKDKIKNNMSSDTKNQMIRNAQNQQASKVEKDPDYKPPVIRTYSKAKNKVMTNMREFSQTQYGKKVIEASKDSIKVASAIGMGAAAFGMTQQFNDVYSAGSFGYGFANGMFENSSKTTVETGSEMLAKHMEAQGISKDQIPELMKDIRVKIDAGDLKNIPGEIDKIVDKLAAILGSKKDATDIYKKIQTGYVPGEKLNYQSTVETIIEQNNDLSEEESEEVRELASKIEELRFIGSFAPTMETWKGFGGNDDSYRARLDETVTQYLDIDVNISTDRNGRTNYNYQGRTPDGSNNSSGSGAF